MLTVCNVFTHFTLVAPEEGLFCKPKYRAIFCYIHFLTFVTLRVSGSVSFFNCRIKDQSFRIFFLPQVNILSEKRLVCYGSVRTGYEAKN